MDIKLFYKDDGGVIQLIELEKIKDWSIEMPFIFVEYIRSNKLRSYRDPKVEAEISQYLNEILNKTAIPKVKQIFGESNQEEILSILSIFEELSETNTRAVTPIQNLLENLTKHTNKTIVSQARKVLANIKE
ncbi:MAG: hypothetical protein JSV23_09220 [Promethearchaeota archaeon]|nr:MAG: hypothetical protein JSV23_09220 [Candidatus Lokiarchaeota archaeon]